MSRRLKLHELLKQYATNVYFQPPSSVVMKYPAIVYTRDDIDNSFADNQVYKQSCRYQITVIDKNPDSKIVEEISGLPTCSFERHFTQDNLNHDVFTIHF